MRHRFYDRSSRSLANRGLLLLTGLLSATTTLSLASAPAHAELPERKSPLADAPAVRHRTEMRRLRFEIGPGVTSTVGQDFYHALLVGGKGTLFLTDWLAVAGFAGHNITPDMKTSFHERLVDDLRPMPEGRSPSIGQAQQGMNKIGQVFAGQVELIPFSGKYSLFSRFFANYDFYGFGGLGVINFKGSSCATPGPSCPVTGMKFGINFGVGIHTYFNDYFSANVEFRDILLRNNPSGRDVSGDRVADDDDMSLDSNYMIGLNFTFLLPPTARVSD